MKKTLIYLFVLSSLFLTTTAFVFLDKVQVPLSCERIKHGSGVGQMPRNPNDPPVVYLEDYTLTFEVDHPEFVLYIKDEDEVVVYSTVVTSATTEVVLPSTLSGDYEIELIMGDWLFSGWIYL